jgi:hypothetical protein
MPGVPISALVIRPIARDRAEADAPSTERSVALAWWPREPAVATASTTTFTSFPGPARRPISGFPAAEEAGAVGCSEPGPAFIAAAARKRPDRPYATSRGSIFT